MIRELDHVLNAFQRAISKLDEEPIEGRLWIVEAARIRIRGGD